MPAKLEAEQKSLLKIFSDDYLFYIPDYQRPYAWTTEQTSELLDDLLYAIKDNNTETKNKQLDELPPYFLGSIVIIKDTDHGPVEVVDGQQRLTTLTILLCVLRELSEDLDLGTELDEYVRQVPKKTKGTEELFRITLRERDRDFFQKNIQTRSELLNFIKEDNIKRKDSRQRMFENTKYLYEKLSKLDSERRDMLVMFIIQHCFLVVVSASDRNSAYRIFSVLNDRGLDLSPTDILKAYIIGGMDEKSRAKYAEALGRYRGGTWSR